MLFFASGKQIFWLKVFFGFIYLKFNSYDVLNFKWFVRLFVNSDNYMKFPYSLGYNLIVPFH